MPENLYKKPGLTQTTNHSLVRVQEFKSKTIKFNSKELLLLLLFNSSKEVNSKKGMDSSSTTTKSYASFNELYYSCQQMEKSNSIITSKILEISFLPYLSEDFSPFKKGTDIEGKDYKKYEKVGSSIHQSYLVNWNGREIPVTHFFKKVKTLMNHLRDLYKEAINFVRTELKNDFMSSFQDNSWVTKQHNNYNLSFGISYKEDLKWHQIEFEDTFSNEFRNESEVIVGRRIKSLEALHNVNTQIGFMQTFLKREISRVDDRLEKLRMFSQKLSKHISKLRRVISIVEGIIKLKFEDTISINIEKNDPKSLKSICQNFLRKQQSIIIPMLD